MNKTTVSIFFIIIYLLSAINPVYCQDNEQITKYSFSFGTGFGIIWGQAFEYVYPVPGETKGELLSELIWDMKPVCYASFSADFGLTDLLSGPGFFSSLSLKAGIPAYSGVMEDRDWQSIVNSNLTNFSSHENETNEHVRVDLTAGVSFPMNFLYIKPFISGSWMHFIFTGSNGYSQYAKETPKDSGIYEPIEDAPVISLGYGKLITYQQDWLILAAGCSIGTNILYPVHFELSFKLSPHTYCEATDRHIRRGRIFKDLTSFGLFLEPGCSISLDVKKIKFSLDASYRYISRTKGESYYGYNDKIYGISTNKAGAALSVMDFQFLIKLTL
ncbi:MAG: omptin family outer membrane protease [Treponema sp.]|jgi:outer membrane protease|nr:omptin family outer membrane protease [Treponema sp.]